MIEQQLLTIIIPVSMKSTLVDELIAYKNISGFTMTKVAGFSRQHSQYNIQEQVVGYKGFYRIEVVLNTTEIRPLLQHLCQFKDRYPLRYWLLPLNDAGVIDSDSDCQSINEVEANNKEQKI